MRREGNRGFGSALWLAMPAGSPFRRVVLFSAFLASCQAAATSGPTLSPPSSVPSPSAPASLPAYAPWASGPIAWRATSILTVMAYKFALDLILDGLERRRAAVAS